MQKIKFGAGKINTLKKILYFEKPEKILLLRGQKSYDNFSSIISNIIEDEFHTFTVTESNISLGLLEYGIDYYNGHNCDLIISIGGGSVIDMGKLVSLFSTNKSKPHDYITGKKKYIAKKNKLIAIPTTSGSGSEATQFAVIYDGITKYSVSHISLLPDYSIIDPELTHTLTNNQTAISGMDAFCQAIESYWSLKSTLESRSYSNEAIELILDNLESAVLNPTRKSRTAMSKASYLAGKAINIAKTTAAHAFSYPLTNLFKIPHGHAVSLSLPYFYSHICRYIEVGKSNIQLVEKMRKLNLIIGKGDALVAQNKIISLIEKIGLSTRLRKGIDYSSNVNKVVKNINLERLSNYPVPVSEEDLRYIFKQLCI